MTALGDLVAATWFTEASGDTVAVLLAPRDGGRSFGQSIHMDDPADGRQALGRVDVALENDGIAIVSWLDGTPAPANILAREVAPDGRLSEITPVAETSPARTSGFPRMVRSRKRLVFAWTEPGKTARVRTAMAELK